MKLYFDDEGLDGQLQRAVSKCDAGMAKLGELWWHVDDPAAQSKFESNFT